jgi:hypothetical protein
LIIAYACGGIIGGHAAEGDDPAFEPAYDLLKPGYAGLDDQRALGLYVAGKLREGLDKMRHVAVYIHVVVVDV